MKTNKGIIKFCQCKEVSFKQGFKIMVVFFVVFFLIIEALLLC